MGAAAASVPLAGLAQGSLAASACMASGEVRVAALGALSASQGDALVLPVLGSSAAAGAAGVGGVLPGVKVSFM